MMRFILYCLPAARRIGRPRLRRVTRGAGIATAAKVGAVAVAVGGPACFLLPIWGGPATLPSHALPAAPRVDPFLEGISIGGFGGPLDGRDFAALAPAFRAVELLPHTTLLPLDPGGPTLLGSVPPPVTEVPEPSSFAILAGALVALAALRRWVRA